MIDIRYCPCCKSELKLKYINGRQYKACDSESCGYVFYDNPLTVVAALVEHEGMILLARNKEWPEKMFGLITGFLEKNETPEEAVRREVKEELGLDSVIAGLIGIYSFFERNQLILAYHLKAEGRVSLGEELAEFKQVLPQKLKSWPFGTGLVVRDWLNARGTGGQGGR